MKRKIEINKKKSWTTAIYITVVLFWPRNYKFLDYINIGTTCLPIFQGVITLCDRIRWYILNTRTMRTITGHGISRVSFEFLDCFRQTSLLIPRQQLFSIVSQSCYYGTVNTASRLIIILWRPSVPHHKDDGQTPQIYCSGYLHPVSLM